MAPGCAQGRCRGCAERGTVRLQVRRYLHVVLCFSPVGNRFRVRARQFPALVNCTSFDWFHTWPSEAWTLLVNFELIVVTSNMMSPL